MGKRLVIAEKPSVAKDIAAALGGFAADGDVYESDELVVTSAVGHLLELAQPKHYDKAFGSWSLKNLPIIPEEFAILPKDGQKKNVNAIKKLGKRKDIDGIINACDAGREGELIFRRIVEFTGLDEKPMQRLWLQSMTKDSIREAFTRLEPSEHYDGLSDAAWCRSVGDWLIGMNATRALTQRLKSRGDKHAWSAGRVQTPTLALLVRREREVMAHIPRPFYEITGAFSHGDTVWEGRLWDTSLKTPDDEDSRANRLFDLERAKALIAQLQDAKSGEARETRKKSNENPPLPFDLTRLQREANRRFSFSAKRTLDAAQRLYAEHKVLTYPRTDSRHLPEDYEETLNKVLEALCSDAEYQGVADKIVEAGPKNLDKLLDNTKISDHFAIVPTGAEPEKTLSSDDTKIFDLVVRQFLAALMGPAVWATVERNVDVTAGDVAVTFRTTARSLEIPGFREALGQEAGSGSSLPSLVPGQDKSVGVGVGVDSVTGEEKQTKPPSRYSEAALLRIMETAGQLIEDDELSDAMKDRGLGTPATRADTIEGLIRKQYARRSDRKLMPTAKAMRLIDVIERLDVTALASAQLTGQWERDLHRVRHGELERQAFLDSLIHYTKDVVEALRSFEHSDLYANMEPLGVCPACQQGEVRETTWGYSCTRNTGRDSECSFMIWKESRGRFIDRRLAKRLMEEKTVGPIGGFPDPRGRLQEATLHLEINDSDRWTVRVDYSNSGPDDTPEEVIGVLGSCSVTDDDGNTVVHEIIETNKRYVARGLLDKEIRKGPQLPKVVCHREMSPDEARVYFSEGGKTEVLDGFISRRGRPFRGALFRKPTGKHGFEFPPRESKKKDGSKTTTGKSTAKKTTTRKPKARKTTAKKTTAGKTTAKKTTARKTTAKKTSASKTTAKKASTAKKKSSTRKTAAAKESEAAAKAVAEAKTRKPRKRTLGVARRAKKGSNESGSGDSESRPQP